MPKLDCQRLIACKRCPRLQHQFRRLRRDHPDYWNRPVPPSADPEEARLMIVGLAPGMHGANRTGVPFTGDASGDLLFKVLDELGITREVAITNAVKCLPVANLPTSDEVRQCARFLKPEIDAASTVLALGGVAHRAILAVSKEILARRPFVHGAVHHLAGITLIDSYHCSRYNIHTGRLTEVMFRDVVELAARHAGLRLTR